MRDTERGALVSAVLAGQWLPKTHLCPPSSRATNVAITAALKFVLNCVYVYPQSPEEGIRYHEDGVTGSCN